jgi:hypothetical protein
MRRRRVTSVAIVVIAAMAGGALALAGDKPATAPPSPAPAPAPPRAQPSPLIYPAETIPLRFDHAQHARLGATCEGCHLSAQTSTSAADNLMPREAACRACHKIDRAQPEKTVPKGQGAARCDACHADNFGNAWMPGVGADAGADQGRPAEPPRVVLARPNLKFNHQLHAARGVACTTCHVNAATQAMVTRADLPMMATCLACHDGKQATARCTACHLAEPDGRVKTKLASAATAAAGGTGPLLPTGSLRALDTHGPTFRRDHAPVARDESYCLSCHKRNDCIDCHGGVVKPPDIHPADYVSMHGIDARRNVPDCSTCHRAQSFCLGCHQRVGVVADPEGGIPGRRPQNPFGSGTGLKQFHPPGWARDASGEVLAMPRPASHSLAAKRNIRACVSCHREDSCLACHSTDVTRGPVFSPHGPNFGGTARCRLLSARNQRVCLKCHTLGSPQLECD